MNNDPLSPKPKKRQPHAPYRVPPVYTYRVPPPLHISVESPPPNIFAESIPRPYLCKVPSHTPAEPTPPTYSANSLPPTYLCKVSLIHTSADFPPPLSLYLCWVYPPPPPPPTYHCRVTPHMPLQNPPPYPYRLPHASADCKPINK